MSQHANEEKMKAENYAGRRKKLNLKLPMGDEE